MAGYREIVSIKRRVEIFPLVVHIKCEAIVDPFFLYDHVNRKHAHGVKRRRVFSVIRGIVDVFLPVFQNTIGYVITTGNIRTKTRNRACMQGHRCIKLHRMTA